MAACLLIQQPNHMKLITITDRTSELVEELTVLWEASVRATHKFLSNDEILMIKQYVPEAFRGIPSLTAAVDDSGKILGFIGTAEKRIEMLFVAPELRGQGIGRKLLENAVENQNVDEVTVNEQNPQAVGFYEHMGFETYKRTPLDEQGNLYPLLYMRRKSTQQPA